VQSIKTMKSRPGSGASHPTHQSVRKLLGRSVVIYYEVSKDRIDILRFSKPQGSQP
jgi:plasmid stabilization system protein ParE